jgi:hypothetical protein
VILRVYAGKTASQAKEEVDQRFKDEH